MQQNCKDSQSGAICTDAASDVKCFGRGLAIWYLNGSFCPSPILSAYLRHMYCTGMGVNGWPRVTLILCTAELGRAPAPPFPPGSTFSHGLFVALKTCLMGRGQQDWSRAVAWDWWPHKSRASWFGLSKDVESYWNMKLQLKCYCCSCPACLLCRTWAQASQNRSRKTKGFGSCLERTRLLNCVKHSCYSESRPRLVFTRNLFKTSLSSLTRSKASTYISCPHVNSK